MAGFCLWAFILLLAICRGSAANVRLDWDDPSPAPNVSYRVYQSLGSNAFLPVASTTFLTVILPLDTNQLTRWYVTAVNVAGQSPISNVVTNFPAVTPPASALVFEAESGTITGPFYIAAGAYIQQDVPSGLLNGGRATYAFTATNAGDYTVSMLLNAPDGGANSIFLNIDVEPIDPESIWDIPITAGFQKLAASWRGAGAFDNNQFVPKVFFLGTGQHTLIIRGRESGVQIDRIEIKLISPQPPPQPPAAPQNLRVNMITKSRVDVEFDADSKASTKIERSKEFGAFVQVSTLAPGVLHWSDTSVRKGRDYRYRARSCNSSGCSIYSNAASISL